MEQTCTRCGAPTTGLVCEYCGSLTSQLADSAAEEKAIDEFHEILLTKDEDAQVKMLKSGFIPDSPTALIEAGVHCIPLIDTSSPNDDVVAATAARLQAIVTKLKLMPDFEKKQQAIDEFEAVLQAVERANRNTDRFLIGVAVVMGLLLVICAGGSCYYFMLL